MKLQKGAIYEMEAFGRKVKAVYIGRQDFSCCVCDKGHNVKTFNIYYEDEQYETWGFGEEHMPPLTLAADQINKLNH